MMRGHSSTRERADVLGPFYEAVFAPLGRPETVLDVGCGSNPLARPWMPLDPGTLYLACDIDLGQLDFVGRALALLGYRAETFVADAGASEELPAADVALLLKLLPALDARGWQAGIALVESLRCPRVVLSLPGQSLGGRKQAMGAAHGQRFETIAAARGWRLTAIAAPGSEVVYLVER
jgi:16S rRNA (guanine(1405)-N(7))-methyltransferase